MVSRIVREKEKRIKEGMKIMGMRNSAFYCSWFITYFIIFTLASILSSLAFMTFFTHSGWFWIFLWYWETTMGLLAMGIFITVLFSKARVANVTAFFLALFFGLIEKYATDQNASEVARFFASLAVCSSMASAFNHIVDFEAAEKGLTSETVGMLYQNYRVTYHYIGTLISFTILILLSIYLEQVLPSEFGIKKHPLFCLRRRRDRRETRQVHDSSYKQLDPANFEETDPSLKAQDANNESIMVKDLRKIYPNGKLAVDGVSYNMYRGQIFALLGHNGAGKTSTINMITGLYPATSGTVSVFGKDIHEQLDDIRKIMGVCPQHDVLFDDLTVAEHLELFAIFKGADRTNLQAEIDKIIEDLDLTDKRNYLSKHLSGGQKRKLCIGIAFIGGSKFILLDEPSSGMDTSARRRLWDMLKNYKHGKVILLTTHYMDEADYLGDRIAIMGEGKIQCLGRPLFLKNRFGVGYSLTIVKNTILDPSEPIIKFIKSYIPEAKITSNASAELSMQLPLETVGKFKALFEGIDKNLKDLKISSYGVSVTTLEEVFLNVSKITGISHNKKDNPSETSHIQNHEEEDFDLESERITGRWKLFTTHFAALFIKRYRYFKRDVKGLIIELFLPVLMVAIGIGFAKGGVFPDPEPLPIVTRFYGEVNEVAYNSILPDSSTLPAAFINQGFDSADFQMIPKSINNIATFDDALFIDKENMDNWRKFSFFVTKFDNAAKEFEYQTLIDTRAQDASPFAMNMINQAIIRYASNNYNLKISTTIDPFPKTTGSAALENAVNSVNLAYIFAIGMAFIPAGIATFIVKERETNVKHQQIISGMSISGYWLSNYCVDVVKYLIPAVLSCILAKAMDADSLVAGQKYGALWVLFLVYGLSITPFVYLTSFAFNNHAAAQTANFFGHFVSGFVLGLAVTILRIIEATNSVAKVLQWIFRINPTFSLTYGFLNLSNLEVLANVEQDYTRTAWDVEAAGGDIIFLAITAAVYFILVFVVEGLRSLKCFSKYFSHDVPSAPQERDPDVEVEMERIEKANLGEFSVGVRNLRKVFKISKNNHKVAVDKISFGITNGECFALLGVNGAGKTTTFKMLTGEVIPTKGEIFINGYEVPTQIEKARKYIGYCPQFDALLENLTAREHLELYAAIKGIPKHKREALILKQLRELNLAQFENIPAGTYSGGNKRKLSVAIAMIGNPPIVFLDEPSNGMDPEARRFMWNAISRISTERKHSSVILTTHSMEEAEALATKIGIQVDGNFKCLGSAQHIKNIYGGGFELEIKTNLPNKEQIKGLVTSLGFQHAALINKDQVNSILSKTNLAERLAPELSETGSGSAIFLELKKKGKIPVDMVVEWVLIEKNGLEIEGLITSKFTEVKLIEHFQSFYRYKISSDISIGQVFGIFEENKEKLNIMQYSVKQSSLEQIFNAFANNAIQYRKRPPEIAIHIQQ